MQMFLFQDSGEINIRRHFMMSKCLMLMRFHIVVPKYPHFIDILNVRNDESMNNVLEKLRWTLLPHLYFQHLVVWVMLLLYFTELTFLISLQK